MKRYVLITTQIALVIGCSVLATADEDLQLAVTDGPRIGAVIATTTDQNREQRVSALTTLLANVRPSAAQQPEGTVQGAIYVLGKIASSETPLAILAQYLDDATQEVETRSQALYALGEVTRRVRGEQAMIQKLRSYLESNEWEIAIRAKSSLASTNAAEAVNLLQTLLDAHVAALPLPGFSVTEGNGMQIESLFNAVIADALALNTMQRPEAKAKVQETLTYLRTRYTSGLGLKAAGFLEGRLAQE